MLRSWSLWLTCLLAFNFVASFTAVGIAEDYQPADAGLKTVLIDSHPKESFLAVQADTLGRLFVGGREALFVYEPDSKGGYKPRQELYRFPDHTWVYDIALRGNDVYVLTVSALYVIPDAVTKREGLKPKRLIWGVPMGHVHQCFHGMTLGPEGDVYFAMGDPLWYYGDFSRPDHWGHWTFFSQPDGTKTPYTGVGGVFRCKPDGSDFRIVARGLRNSCGLAFDRHWNLFSNDNDHESMPAQYVPGRLVHVTPHTDFSWPRGWLLSKMPDRADLLETMFDGMGRAVPVGQAYYDDTFLPAFRNNLLVARWCIRAVTRYPLERRGASFKVTEEHLLDGKDQARPVGVSVGRGGRIFTTICYMAQNEGSPVYKSDLVMITRQDDPPTHPFEAYEATTASTEKLFAELSDPSWSRRYQAHQEILRRGNLWEEANHRHSKAAFDDPAVTHLIWIAAAGAPATKGPIDAGKLEGAPADVVLQAVRAFAEYPRLGDARLIFEWALKHSDPQVVHAGLLGLFNLPGPVPAEVVQGPARSKDTYLRQAATLLLAEKSSPAELAPLCKSSDSATRLAGVLAIGSKLTLPPATEPIAERFPLDKLRTEDAYVLNLADEKVDLRTLGRVGNFTLAEHWKQPGHTPEQEQLFELLLKMLDDADEPIRLQAAHFLSLLNDPRSEPGVARVTRDNEERKLQTAPVVGVAKVWVAGPFSDGNDGFARVHPPQQGPIDTSATYKSDARTVAWQQVAERFVNFNKLFGPVDNSSFYSYFRLESGSRQRIQLLVGSDDGVQVWQNGTLVFTNDIMRGALPSQDVILLDLQPGSNDMLVRVRNRTGESGLYLMYRALSGVASVLPEKLDISGLAERLASAGQGKGETAIPADFLKVNWQQAAAEGNHEQGKKLFEASGCIKCHALSADAATIGGPSLADARKRFTVPYLVESILLPNKQISPVFKSTLVETDDGRQFSGLVVGETADKLDLLLPDAKRVTLLKKGIERRELQNLSPMPQGIVKTPAELRDLLAYLLGEGSK
jgi:putative heme-binding domain-containing protein